MHIGNHTHFYSYTLHRLLIDVNDILNYYDLVSYNDIFLMLFHLDSFVFVLISITMFIFIAMIATQVELTLSLCNHILLCFSDRFLLSQTVYLQCFE